MLAWIAPSVASDGLPLVIAPSKNVPVPPLLPSPPVPRDDGSLQLLRTVAGRGTHVIPHRRQGAGLGVGGLEGEVISGRAFQRSAAEEIDQHLPEGTLGEWRGDLCDDPDIALRGRHQRRALG